MHVEKKPVKLAGTVRNTGEIPNTKSEYKKAVLFTAVLLIKTNTASLLRGSLTSAVKHMFSVVFSPVSRSVTLNSAVWTTNVTLAAVEKEHKVLCTHHRVRRARQVEAPLCKGHPLAPTLKAAVWKVK